jgi:hypothetical protein
LPGTNTLAYLVLSSATKKKSFIRLPPEEPFEEAGAVGEVLETVDAGGPAEPFEYGRGRLVLASPHCRNRDLGPDSQYNIFRATYKWARSAIVFVPGKPFQPSFI